jgi:hypothetical protein
MQYNFSQMLRTLTPRNKLVNTDVVVEEGTSYEVKTYEAGTPGDLVEERTVVNKAYYQPDIDKAQAIIDKNTALQDKCAE